MEGLGEHAHGVHAERQDARRDRYDHETLLEAMAREVLAIFDSVTPHGMPSRHAWINAALVGA